MTQGLAWIHDLHLQLHLIRFLIVIYIIAFLALESRARFVRDVQSCEREIRSKATLICRIFRGRRISASLAARQQRDVRT
jgi:hypothetical protein